MIEFLRKFENRSIKIARVNSILITKSINLQLLTLILYGFGVRCISPFIEKSMTLPNILVLTFIKEFNSLNIDKFRDLFNNKYK